MHDPIICPSCGATNDIGRLIGPQTNNCPECGAQALFSESQTMKQTEQTYIKAGYTVARAIRAKNAARARAAIQNFDLLLALELQADRDEARRLYIRGYNEGQH